MSFMPTRKIPKPVLEIFDRYKKEKVRNLNRQDAVAMLMKEFNLKQDEADQLFDTFDQDKNDLMSVWEFQQFYQTVGDTAEAMVQLFKELDTDHSGVLDMDEARKGIANMKTATGRALEEKEIEFFLQTTAGDDNVIDLGEFGNMLYRLKVYKADPPPKEGIKYIVPHKGVADQTK